MLLDFAMPLKLWLATVAVLVLSAEVTGRCEDQISIKFKALIGHTFKTWLAGNPYQCHLKCQDDMRCQSFNFVIRNGGCEMNNQTKETRPKDLIDDNERFYMKRWPKGGRTGMLHCACSSISQSKNASVIILYDNSVSKS